MCEVYMPKKCWCGNAQLTEYSPGYYKCEDCYTLISKHCFDNTSYEVKDEETSLYGKNYWSKYILSMTKLSSLDEVIDLYLRERTLYWLKTLLKYRLPPANTVEVGCGLGQFSYLLSHVGFSETAMELSQQICDYVKDQLNINMICGELHNLSGNADVIVANDVIEHIEDVNGFIDDINNRLDEQGLLVIQTPCYNETVSYEELLKTNGRFLEQLKVDQHVFIFSKKSICQLLKDYGFNNIYFEPAYFGDDYDMYFVASKAEVKINSVQIIDEYLNKQENGRIIKSLINLFDQVNVDKEQIDFFQTASGERLRDVGKLTVMQNELQESVCKKEQELVTLQKRLDETGVAAQARLHDVVMLQKRLEEIEGAAATRLQDVFTLTELVKNKQNETQSLLEKHQLQDKALHEMQEIMLQKEEIIKGYKHYYQHLNDKFTFRMLKKFKLLF